jgi:hypothetical protein
VPANHDRAAEEPAQQKSSAKSVAANAAELEWLFCPATTLQTLRTLPSDTSTFPCEPISAE